MAKRQGPTPEPEFEPPVDDTVTVDDVATAEAEAGAPEELVDDDRPIIFVEGSDEPLLVDNHRERRIFIDGQNYEHVSERHYAGHLRWVYRAMMLLLALALSSPVAAQSIMLAPTAPEFGGGAQSGPCPGASAPIISIGTPFRVCATHDGVGTTHYFLDIDRPGTLTNSTQLVPVTALTSGAVWFEVPVTLTTFPVGSYTARVCARNVDPGDASNFGENCTAPLAFTIAKPVMNPPPMKPVIVLTGVATVVVNGVEQRVPIHIVADTLQLGMVEVPTVGARIK